MLEAGKRYTVTETRCGQVERRFTARVDWIKDRGDHWHIGYTPDDYNVCRFGAVKVKKQGKYKVINYTFTTA